MRIPEEILVQEQPFFIFSEAEIESSVLAAREFWQTWSLPGFEIFFSIKVNPNPHLLRIMEGYVDGFDVSSLSEARLVKSLGVASSRITWSGPAKTDRALSEVLPWGLRCFHLDSYEEYEQLQKRKAMSRFSLRLSTSQIHSQKLGFSDLELKKIKDPGHAVHSYLGRETFSVETISDFEARLERKIQDGFFVEQPEIYLGAGLPSRGLIEKHLRSLRPSKAPSRTMHLESGRGLIQSAGWYGSKILALKKSEDGKMAIIDGGLQHLASHFLSPRFKDEGVQLQFYRDGQELLDRSDRLVVHGSLSLWHDTMISNVTAPQDLRRGDWVVANHVGAYGYSTASNQFLGPTPVKEWLVMKNSESLRDISADRLIPYHEARR